MTPGKIFVALTALIAAVGIANPIADAATSSGQAAAASGGVVGAVTVSPTTIPSSYPAGISLLAGDPDHLVFLQSGGFSDDEALGIRNSSVLYLANADGTTKSLGLVADTTNYFPYRYSVEGSFVTWSNEDITGSVSWVNIGTLAHGTTTIPTDATYLGSTPTGWAYIEGNALYTETPSGSVTLIGDPLGNAAGENVTQGATGPDGMLVADSQSNVAYVPYDDPAAPVTLQTADFSPTAMGGPAGSVEYLDCSVPTASTAMCAASSPGQFGYKFRAAERVSLTGGAPFSTKQDFDNFAVSDAAIGIGVADFNNFDLTVSNADGSEPTMVPGRVVQSVGAFNKIIYTAGPDDTETFKSVDSPTDAPATFLTPPAGEVDASALSLSAGHVVWSDDAAAPGSTARPSHNLWTRPIQNVGGKVVLGRRHHLMGDPQPEEGFAADGTTFAHSYVDPSDADYLDTTITTPVSTYTFAFYQSVEDDPPPADYFSGDRLLADHGLEVINLISKRVRDFHGPIRASALFGDEYFYMRLNGSVWKLNLTSDTRTELSPPDTTQYHPSMYAWGYHVAYENPDDDVIHVIDIRHPKLRYSVTGPGKNLAELSNDGMYINDMTDSSGTTDDKLWFRPYGAHQKERRLLANQTVPFVPTVEINGNLVTWLGTDAAIHAAPLPTASNRPWYLGNPGIVRPHAKPTTTKILAPFSAVLTHCKVLISRGKKQLASLPCQRSAADDGSAFVTWNGKTSAGKTVDPGSVRWQVKASNQFGSVLTDRGSEGAVTGTFTVTRR